MKQESVLKKNSEKLKQHVMPSDDDNSLNKKSESSMRQNVVSATPKASVIVLAEHDYTANGNYQWRWTNGELTLKLGITQ